MFDDPSIDFVVKQLMVGKKFCDVDVNIYFKYFGIGYYLNMNMNDFCYFKVYAELN